MKRNKINMKRNYNEHQIQAGIIAAVEHIPACRWLHAIPNGGHRHIGVAKKLKAEGVKSGVSDLFLPYRRLGEVCIETSENSGITYLRMDMRSPLYVLCKKELMRYLNTLSPRQLLSNA